MRRRRSIVLLATLAVIAPVSTGLALQRAGAAPAGSAVPPSAGIDASAVAELTAPQPSEPARHVRRELRTLAEAWSLGGGRYGFPYWEKAWHRWRDREIGASAFREYVTGYRDTLRPGCELLDDLDLEVDAVRDIRSSLVEACHERVSALRSQQQRLDLLVEKDPAATRDERLEREATLQRLDAEFEMHLQHSYALTRVAMNDTQAQLDALELERIDEDAFI